jgi:mRNA-degrading endonuclease RelE of RelBE toxin-antitoxin system
MTLSFVETRGFTAALPEYFADDDVYRQFQEALLADPERGTVIRGCGGLRKIRWRDERRGKGTRGGLRLIYLHVPEAQIVLLLDVYDKDETSDLTTAQRSALAALAQDFRHELLTSVSKQSGRQPKATP